MRKINSIDVITLILVIIGAINWGLVGLFRYNLVEAIFGSFSTLSRIVYVLVGLSGVYLAFISPGYSRTADRDRDRVTTGGRAAT
jgi:uncharacterized protein